MTKEQYPFDMYDVYIMAGFLLVTVWLTLMFMMDVYEALESGVLAFALSIIFGFAMLGVAMYTYRFVRGGSNDR